MLVSEERGKPEYPEKNLSEQRREPTTNSTHIWRRRRDLNPGHLFPPHPLFKGKALGTRLVLNFFLRTPRVNMLSNVIVVL